MVVIVVVLVVLVVILVVVLLVKTVDDRIEFLEENGRWGGGWEEIHPLPLAHLVFHEASQAN
jgi:hypothetical protein